MQKKKNHAVRKKTTTNTKYKKTKKTTVSQLLKNTNISKRECY